MALPNARNQYLKTQIETASKEQLVVMLFDGIIRFTDQARRAIEEKSVEGSHHALMRAQAIIMELICTVNKEKGGEVANNLMSLHAYAFNCLIVCNLKKDVSKIDEVQKIYRELKEGWVGAMDTLGISSNAGKPLAPPPTGGPGAPAPRAPLAPAAAKPVGSGIMASAAPAAAKPAAPAPVPAKPATYGMGQNVNLAAGSANLSGGAASAYGINRNAAMLGAMMANAAPVPAPQPQHQMQPAVYAKPAPVVAAPVAQKQNAVLNAYTSGAKFTA